MQAAAEKQRTKKAPLLLRLKEKIRSAMMESPTGLRLIHYLMTKGFIHRILAYLNKIKARDLFQNPTPEMLESQKFFADNSERVRKVASWLADEASRDAYLKMVDYLCYNNPDNFPECGYNTMYFSHDFLRYTNDEVIIDCGAFIGDSIPRCIEALKRYHGNYKSYIAFEPDEDNYRYLQHHHGWRKGLKLIKAGLYNCDTELNFSVGLSLSSHIIDSEAPPSQLFTSIIVKAIDNIPECKDATFIKMDIEGAELDALKGAEKTIRRNKPVLAICIYHSDEDMIRIAEWIHDLDLGYSLYVRQHGNYIRGDTVLYAV